MKEKLRATVAKLYANMHSRNFVPPVQSLMDMDFYKLTMGQFIHKFHADVEVTFKLIIRDKNVRLWKYVDLDQLRQSFDYVQSLTMRKTDIYYLRGMDLYGGYMFTEEFLNFLRTLKLSGYKIERKDGTVEITFTAPWSTVSYWETIALAIVSELYYRGVMKDMSEGDVHDLYTVADNRLQTKLLEIKQHPGIKFADFGQRRRNSFLWQKYAIGEARRVLGSQFTGTSNTWMAFHYDENPIGTNAHELPMVMTALVDGNTDDMRQAQYVGLKQWEELYGQGLRIALPDTYGSEQFFANAPAWLTSWRGQRQDSGDPVIEGERYMSWLKQYDIEPMSKITIFSDGLDVAEMKSISEHFAHKHLHAYGWGTLFTNDFRGSVPGNDDMRPFSMACKVVSADGHPCVKLSNDVSKATGPKSAIAKYLEVFGSSGRTERNVVV